MKVSAFDLTRQYLEIGLEIEAAVAEVMAKGHFILGQHVQALESEIAEYVGVKHGIGVANGSDALHLALLALNVGPGDEVIVPSFTFFATGGAVARAGATPVFVDVDPETYNMAPESFMAAITDRTKAVIPVHLYGNAADMDSIMSIARGHGVMVVEDCAQAIGAEYKGRRVGSFGDVATFSFFPTKNLGAFGDAGMVVTDNEETAMRVQRLRVHGAEKKYFHTELGYNSRLDELQAAILRVKLRHLNAWTSARRRLAAAYGAALEGASVICPTETIGGRHVYHQYTIRTDMRDDLQAHLQAHGIGSTVYYPTPLHLQPVFGLAGAEGKLPHSEAAARQVLSLPMFPELTLDEVQEVVRQIRAV